MKMRDYYREWSYQDRCYARDNREREAVKQWDRDSESGEAAYQQWRNGNEFSDLNPDGRFH
jgi:hypothetical protein